MRTVDKGVPQGELVQSLSAPSRTHREGRVCCVEGCGTRLSIYNPDGRCWQHEPAHVYLLRAPRKRRRRAA